MIRITKKMAISRKESLIIRTSAILFSFILLGIFINTLGKNPIEVYIGMVKGSVGTAYRLQETIMLAIPLILSALGISMAFKMKFWNIGGEGQIIMGAFFGSFLALKVAPLDGPLMIPCMLLAGFIGGGLWALIPTIFKVRFETNETLFTLMLNYIALKWIVFLQYGPWKDVNAQGFPKIPNFIESALLPDVFGVHAGWIIAIIMVVVIHVLLNHTKTGFEISVIGDSVNTARYAGMEVDKVILKTLFISGGLCGLAGVIQTSGVNDTLSVDVAGGVGYTAIIIAWLSGVNALVIPFVAFLFAMMQQGADFIQTGFQIPKSAAEILQALILFSVLSSEFLIQYNIHWETGAFNKKTRKGDA